ncbi:MAG: response regulator [Clostridiales bacterium]|nr:response regulator [Clostridiales bacterium]
MIKVLIVDDASFMRLALKRMLEHNGFQIVGEAENGVEAIKRYFECKPDIVTMDITMPGMTGIEALKLIKQKESVINGAITFIVKPFKEDTVVQILKQIGSI